uniref:Transcriptional regulator, AraC family n=1 Tax=Macrostomum lignano TaxID=282301 RepID=A0A1I8JCG2_9PLAT
CRCPKAAAVPDRHGSAGPVRQRRRRKVDSQRAAGAGPGTGGPQGRPAGHRPVRAQCAANAGSGGPAGSPVPGGLGAGAPEAARSFLRRRRTPSHVDRLPVGRSRRSSDLAGPEEDQHGGPVCAGCALAAAGLPGGGHTSGNHGRAPGSAGGATSRLGLPQARRGGRHDAANRGRRRRPPRAGLLRQDGPRRAGHRGEHERLRLPALRRLQQPVLQRRRPRARQGQGAALPRLPADRPQPGGLSGRRPGGRRQGAVVASSATGAGGGNQTEGAAGWGGGCW